MFAAVPFVPCRETLTRLVPIAYAAVVRATEGTSSSRPDPSTSLGVTRGGPLAVTDWGPWRWRRGLMLAQEVPVGEAVGRCFLLASGGGSSYHGRREGLVMRRFTFCGVGFAVWLFVGEVQRCVRRHLDGRS